MNQDFIAKTLCEKRSEPKSCCKGKCHLKKQFTQSSRQEQKRPASLKSEQENFWIVETKDADNLSVNYLDQLQTPEVSNFTFQNYLKSIFHPPSFLG